MIARSGRDGPSLLGRIAALPFIGVILLYRATLSPVVGNQCRFEPTCSKYGLEAYRRHGPIRGTRLTIGRILRCQPFAVSGYDPVPFWGEARKPTIRTQRGDKPGHNPAGPGSARYLDPDDDRPAREGAPHAGGTDQEQP